MGFMSAPDQELASDENGNTLRHFNRSKLSKLTGGEEQDNISRR
jgi:hypothetical protein